MRALAACTVASNVSVMLLGLTVLCGRSLGSDARAGCYSSWTDCTRSVPALHLVFYTHTHTHTHTLNGPFPGQPRWADTRKVKPICILLMQETVSGSGISWAICKSAPRSRQITTPAPHHSVFLTGQMLPKQQCKSTEGTVITPCEFQQRFRHHKLESLGYRVALFVRSYA